MGFRRPDVHVSGIVILAAVGGSVFFATVAGCRTDGEVSANDNGRVVIETESAPAAIGPYSQAIRQGNVVYVAGQVGLDPATGTLVPGGIEAETERAIQNIRAILEAAGYALTDVVQSQVYLSDLAEYSAMNRVYGSHFRDTPPARAAVQVARLPLDARVEIMVTAAR